MACRVKDWTPANDMKGSRPRVTLSAVSPSLGETESKGLPLAVFDFAQTDSYCLSLSKITAPAVGRGK